MKKTSVGYLLIAAIITITAFSTSAFGHEKSLPVGSRAALVSQAIRDVSFISGSLWAQGSLQPTSGQGYFWVEYNSLIPRKDEIRNIIANQPLSYRVINPTNDWINLYASCYSSEGHQLFQGGSGFRLQYGKGGWSVPESARRFEMLLAYEIPIRIKGAIGARIMARDQNGYEMQGVNLRVEYSEKTGVGTIFFRSEYAGTRGELIVSYWEQQPDGSMRQSDVPYSLSGDGEVVETEDGVTSMQPVLPDVVTLTSPNAYMTDIQSQDHVGNVPLGELSVPFRSWNYFHANTKEGDVATAVRILRLGKSDAEWQTYEIPAGGPPYVPVLLEQGVYHVDYDIPGLRPPTPYTPVPVGEKG